MLMVLMVRRRSNGRGEWCAGFGRRPTGLMVVAVVAISRRLSATSAGNSRVVGIVVLPASAER